MAGKFFRVGRKLGEVSIEAHRSHFANIIRPNWEIPQRGKHLFCRKMFEPYFLEKFSDIFLYSNVITLVKMTETLTKDVAKDLMEIKQDLKYIKEHMVDMDSILSEDDKVAIDEARKELKEGKTTSLSDLKKELGL